MKNILISAILFFLISACKNATQKDNKIAQPSIENDIVVLTDAQLKQADLTIATLAKGKISGMLKLNGITELPPQNLISVSAPLGGYLKNTKLIPGMNVRKGEVIATLDDAQFVTLQQDYLTTKAKIIFAEKEYQRQQALNSQNASSDKAAEMATAELTTLRITAKALSEKLKLIGINPDNLSENSISKSVAVYAPISGAVSKVNVNIGKYVQPSEVLFEIIDNSDVHFVLTVFEKDINEIKVGQRLKIIDEAAGKTYTAEILLIGKEMEADRTVKAHCHFIPNGNGVLPGKYMIAEVPVNNREAYLIPAAAVVNSGGKNYVFAAQDATHFKMIEVNAGATENSMTAIDFIATIDTEKTKFVTNGAYTLLMKMKNSAEEE